MKIKLALCECGCGKTAPISKYTDNRRNIIAGQQSRFRHGHYSGPRKGRHFVHGHNVGGRETPELHAYYSAKGRCTNPNDNAYHNYGGRGIRFQFLSFAEFFKEVGERPSSRYSLDRYPNNDGHYEKGNLRWATRKQQNRNKRPYRKKITRFSDQELRKECIRRGWVITTL